MTRMRFNLYYDDKFDRELHQLIQNIPIKRRSEVIRQLILKGMAVDGGEGVKSTLPNRAPSLSHAHEDQTFVSIPSSPLNESKERPRGLGFKPPIG